MTAHDFILFDLDGTLSAPRLAIGRSINRALEHFDTLHDGIPQALAALPETGLPRGLCTSKRRDFAVKILARWARA
jgi:phosphoglycolate phosphatase-like HAD superfamily hydrolase